MKELEGECKPKAETDFARAHSLTCLYRHRRTMVWFLPLLTATSWYQLIMLIIQHMNWTPARFTAYWLLRFSIFL